MYVDGMKILCSLQNTMGKRDSLTEFNNKFWYLSFAKRIFIRPTITNYCCKCISYRDMYLTKHDLRQYSIEISKASQYERNALDLWSIPEFPRKQDVLIGSATCFSTISIHNSNDPIDIQLEQQVDDRNMYSAIELNAEEGVWFDCRDRSNNTFWHHRYSFLSLDKTRLRKSLCFFLFLSP
jgi:hypothetical protein